MDAPRRTVFSLSTLRSLLLPMLVIVFGLQMLRILFPSLVWYLKDTRGASSMSVGGYAFATFLIGFLAAGLRRVIGPRGALWLTAGGWAVLASGLPLRRAFLRRP